MLITFPANVLAVNAKKQGLTRWSRAVKKIKKPFHFIAMGAQSNYRYSLEFIEDIKEEGYDFVKSILETGGKISLRGYFSAEVVRKLGFTEDCYVITGCPSLFTNGRDLKIIKKDIPKEDLKPILNGTHFWFDAEFRPYFTTYKNSIFIDQDVLYRLLLKQEEIPSTILKDVPHLRNGLFEYLYKQKRLRIYADYQVWANEIKAGGYNFSIGGRIHGNIVSLLSGIPAFVDGHDSRVMELADYFHIPCAHLTKAVDMYDIYTNLDYSSFNMKFPYKYDIFRDFMRSIGCPFFEDEMFIQQRLNSYTYTPPPVTVWK